jgi:hypothetical protein
MYPLLPSHPTFAVNTLYLSRCQNPKSNSSSNSSGAFEPLGPSVIWFHISLSYHKNAVRDWVNPAKVIIYETSFGILFSFFSSFSFCFLPYICIKIEVIAIRKLILGLDKVRLVSMTSSLRKAKVRFNELLELFSLS